MCHLRERENKKYVQKNLQIKKKYQNNSYTSISVTC